MADKKKKAPAKPIIGYGTNVKAGKAVTKSVKKAVKTGIIKDAKKAGVNAAKAYKKVYRTGSGMNRMDNPKPGTDLYKYYEAYGKMDAAGIKSLHYKTAHKKFNKTYKKK